MLIPEFFLFKFLLVSLFISLFKNIFEASVVSLQYRILCTKIQRVVARYGVLEARMCECVYRLIRVVHAHYDARCFKVIDLPLSWLSPTLRVEPHLECALLLHHSVSCTILIAERVAANDDRLSPPWNQSRDVLDQDRLSEHSAVQLVSDCAIGRLPHLLEVEFLDADFIRGDGGALNAYLAHFDCICCIEGDLIVCLVTVLHP